MQVQSQCLGICDRKSKVFKPMPWETKNVIVLYVIHISVCLKLPLSLSDPSATKRKGRARAGGDDVSLEVEPLRQRLSPAAPFASWLFPTSTRNSTNSRS